MFLYALALQIKFSAALIFTSQRLAAQKYISPASGSEYIFFTNRITEQILGQPPIPGTSTGSSFCSKAAATLTPGTSLVAQCMKNPPGNAGDVGSTRGLGRSHVPWSHSAWVPQPLNLCSSAAHPNYWSLSAQSPCSTTRSYHSEKPVHCNEEQLPLTATRERPKPTQQRRPSAMKNNKTTQLPTAESTAQT